MARPADKRFWIVLAGITAAALAWRVGYVLASVGRLRLYGDAFYYHNQANHIAQGLWFVDPGQYEFFGRVTPSAGHPPAYLLYLAGVSKVVGTSETTHRLASTLLGAGAVLLIGVLARRVFRSDLAGWIGAALAAGYAHLWINDEMLMSEGMYVLTTVLAVILAYRFWDRPGVRTAAWMGAGIGIAALSRAEAATLLPLLAVPFALLHRARPWRERIRHSVVACVSGGLVLLPWVAFNLTRFEHPVTMSNGIGSVLMSANCNYQDPVTGEELGTYDGAFKGYWRINCSEGLVEKIHAYFPPERAEYLEAELGVIPGTDMAFFGDESTHEVAWRAVGIEEMFRNRRKLPEAVVVRVLRMWDLYKPAQNTSLNAHLEGRGEWQSNLATATYYPLAVLAVAGLVVVRRRRLAPILPFLALAGTITVTAAMTFGITRYRAPVDAMLPVLAGGFLAGAVSWWRGARVRGFGAESAGAETDETVGAPA